MSHDHQAGSNHLSDDELILSLYCPDQTSVHLTWCKACQSRLSAMQSSRDSLEANALPTADLTPERFARQRRLTYEKLTEPVPLWSSVFQLKWLSAGATALLLGGSLFLYQHGQPNTTADDRISDVELAQDVSRLSQSIEPVAAEPLKGLFE